MLHVVMKGRARLRNLVIRLNMLHISLELLIGTVQLLEPLMDTYKHVDH